jgi:hypothetical protein
MPRIESRFNCHPFQDLVTITNEVKVRCTSNKEEEKRKSKYEVDKEKGDVENKNGKKYREYI